MLFSSSTISSTFIAIEDSRCFLGSRVVPRELDRERIFGDVSSEEGEGIIEVGEIAVGGCSEVNAVASIDTGVVRGGTGAITGESQLANLSSLSLVRKSSSSWNRLIGLSTGGVNSTSLLVIEDAGSVGVDGEKFGPERE